MQARNVSNAGLCMWDFVLRGGVLRHFEPAGSMKLPPPTRGGLLSSCSAVSTVLHVVCQHVLRA